MLKSQRLLDLKRLFADEQPGVRVILAAGIADALAEGLVRRSAGALLAGLMATLAAVGRAPQVRRHARLCRATGPHFLAPDAAGASPPGQVREWP